MSIRIIGQIFGSIAGAGAASTGLWFGISKFWNINDSDVFDEASAELLNDITDTVTDVESIDAITEKIQKDPTIVTKIKTAPTTISPPQ